MTDLEVITISRHEFVWHQGGSAEVLRQDQDGNSKEKFYFSYDPSEPQDEAEVLETARQYRADLEIGRRQRKPGKLVS